MSSNDINYDDDIEFSTDDFTFKVNDLDLNDIIYTYDNENAESITNDVDVEWDNFKKDYNNMNKEELIDLIKKDKLRKKQYIQKYQKTPNGRIKTREASKKYYDANRAKILEKKRLAYLKKKQLKNV